MKWYVGDMIGLGRLEPFSCDAIPTYEKFKHLYHNVYGTFKDHGQALFFSQQTKQDLENSVEKIY